MAETAKIRLEVDAKDGQKEVDELDAKIKGLTDKPKSVDVKVGNEGKERVEGFVKQLKELGERVGNGGLDRGFAQVGQAASNFTKGLSEGKSASDSFASSVEGLGSEAIVAGGIIAGVAVAVVKFVTAAFQANIEADNLHRTNQLLGSSFETVRSQTQGLVSSLDALRLKQAGVSSGLALTDDQLASLSQAGARLGSVLGVDTAEALNRVQAALHGDANAARELGVAVSDGSSRVEVANATIQELTRQNGAMGDAVLSAGQEWERFGANVSSVGSSLLSIGAQIGGVVFRPIIELAKLAASAGASFFQSLDEGLRTFIGGNALAEQQAELQRRQLAAQNGQNAEHERTVALMRLEYGALLAQADLQGLGNDLLGTRQSRQAELNRLETEVGNIERRNGEGLEAFLRRRSDLTRALIEARRNDNTEQQKTFDLGIQTGLLQTQLNHARIGLGLGVAALSNNDAIRQIQAEIARIMQTQVDASGHLNNDAQTRVNTLAQQELSLRQAATAQAEQARQARIQYEDTLLLLSIQNQLARAHNEQVGTIRGEVDLARELGRLNAEIANTTVNSARTEADYNRLLERRRTVLQGIVDLEQVAIDRQNQELDAEDRHFALLEHVAQARREYDEAERQAGDADLQRLQRSLSLQTAGLDAQLQLAQAGFQAQAANQRLTESQQQALSHYSSTVSQANQELRDNRGEISRLNESLSTLVEGTDSYNQTLEQRNQLIARQAQLQASLNTVDVAQRSTDALDNLGRRLQEFAGTNRTVSQQLADTTFNAFSTMTGAFKTHLQAVITGKETLGQALQGILHETLLSIASEAAVKAVFNLAEGIANTARFVASYGADAGAGAAATANFTAAATYGVVAGLAGIGAAVTAPSGGGASAGGASAGGVSPVSSGANNAQTQGGPITININAGAGAFLNTREDLEDFIMGSVRTAVNDGRHTLPRAA